MKQQTQKRALCFCSQEQAVRLQGSCLQSLTWRHLPHHATLWKDDLVAMHTWYTGLFGLEKPGEVPLMWLSDTSPVSHFKGRFLRGKMRRYRPDFKVLLWNSPNFKIMLSDDNSHGYQTFKRTRTNYIMKRCFNSLFIEFPLISLRKVMEKNEQK